MKNKTPFAGLLVFVLGIPLLCLAFFCGPCQQHERRPDSYIEAPYRLPTYERQIDQLPRNDRWA